jgi:plasmid stability protein
VKNITVSVSDDVYRTARIRAAELGKSVSALVAEYLNALSEREAEFARLETKQKKVQNAIRRFRACDRLSRDEVHDRAVR